LAGDSSEAKNAFKIAQPEIQRGVTKGIFHKNTASRKLSRLLKRVKAVSA
jgi:small subunit ribosomal protein S20